MMHQQAGGDGAFFHFGTDAEEAAAQIELAMERINAAMNKQLGAGAKPIAPLVNTQEFAQQTREISRPLDEINTRVAQMKQQLRGLFSSVATGSPDPLTGLQATTRNLTTQARAAVVATMQDTQKIMAESMRDMPQSVLRNTDFRNLFRQITDGVVADAEATMKEFRPAAGPLSRATVLPSNAQIERAAEVSTANDRIFGSNGAGPATVADWQAYLRNTPFGSNAQPPGLASSQLANLYRQKTVEDLVRQYFSGASTDKVAVEQQAARLGLSADFALANKPVTQGGLVGEHGPISTTTNADYQDELRRIAAIGQETRAIEQQTQAQNTQARTGDLLRQQAEQRLNLQRAANGELGTALKNGRYLNEYTGRLYVPNTMTVAGLSSKGLRMEDDPTAVAAAYKEVEAAGQKAIDAEQLLARARESEALAARAAAGEFTKLSGGRYFNQGTGELYAPSRITIDGQTTKGLLPDTTPLALSNANEELAAIREKEIQASDATIRTERLLAQQQEQMALAARAAAGEFIKVKGGWFDEAMGRLYSPNSMTVAGLTSKGLIPNLEPNAVKAAREEVDKLNADMRTAQTEAANLSKLLTQGGIPLGRGNPFRPGANWVLNGEAYQATSNGARNLSEEAANASTVEERLMLEEQVRRILAQQTAELEKQAAAELRNAKISYDAALKQAKQDSGVLGGFLGRLHRNDGSISNVIGSQIASAATFTLSYGLLFGAAAAIKSSVDQVLQFQEAYTDLQVATRNTDAVTGQWINTLGELARVAGENVGVAMETAARGIRAFGSAAGDSPEQMQQIGAATNEAATKLALIASEPLHQATGDLIATGTAFGLRPDELNQVVDAVASAKRNIGGDQREISQGLANIAITAHEAGYSLAQTAAVIGLVQSRTDQSGSTVATRLGRIFSIISGATGQALGSQLGVNTTKSIKTQIEQIAKIYADAGPQIQGTIRSRLGGTANLRELLPLLTEQPRLQAAYQDALNNPGAGTAEFERKSNNLIGTLKKIQGSMTAIKTDIGNGGLFAGLGAGVMVLEPALNGLEQMVKFYNDLTGTIPGLQTMLGLMLDIYLAAKAYTLLRGANSLFGGGGADGSTTIIGGKVRQLEVAAIEVATRERALAEARLTGTVAEAAGARADMEALATSEGVAGVGVSTAGAEAGLGAAGVYSAEGFTAAELAGAGAATSAGVGAALLGMLTNPVTWAVAGGIGVFALMGKEHQAQVDKASIENSYVSAQDTFGAIGNTPGQTLGQGLTSAVQDLRSASGEIKNKTLGWFGPYSEQTQLVNSLNSEAAGTQWLADMQVKAEAAATASSRLTNELAAFGDGAIRTTDQLAAGLAQLKGAGQTPLSSFFLLDKALKTPPPRGARFDPQSLATQILTAFEGNKDAALPAGDVPVTDAVGSLPGLSLSHAQAQAVMAKNFGPARMAQLNTFLLDQIKNMHIQNGVITPEQETALVNALANKFDLTGLGKSMESVTNDWVTSTMKSLGLQVGYVGGASFLLSPFRQAALEGQGQAQFGLSNKGNLGLLNGKGALLPSQVLDLLNPHKNADKTDWAGLEAIYQAAKNDLPANDDGTMALKVSRTYLNWLTSLKDRLGKNANQIPQLNADIETAEHDVAQAAIARLETLRQHLQSAPGLPAAMKKSIGRQMLQQEIIAAGTQTDLMIQIMDEADYASLQIVEAHLQMLAAVDAASQGNWTSDQNQLAAGGGRGGGAAFRSRGGQPAQTAAQQNYTTFDNALNQAHPHQTWDASRFSGNDVTDPSLKQKGYKQPDTPTTAEQRAALRAQASTNPDDTVATAAAALRVARANLDAIKDHNSTQYFSALQAVNQAQGALSKAIGAHAAAAAQIAGAQSRSPITQAQGQIEAAAAQMRASTRGTDSWLAALSSYYQAQWQLRDAIVNYHDNLDLLHIDQTNPVATAREAVRAALRKLHSDQAGGAGKDVLAQDKVDYQNKQSAAEAAAFNQRLQDAQTNEQLGRTSFRAYMAYLQHEHERLSAIGHRTRQQQDQLNQVDQAMQSALNGMDAQFNLGDISTNGLVYRARQLAAEQRANSASAQAAAVISNVTHNTNIHISGADLAKIRKIIEQYVGGPGWLRTTQPRRG